MATSTLDPDNIPEPDRSLGRGHDTRALGPSDSSDTGSDVQPGVHAVEDGDIGLDKGTSEDADTHVVDVEGDSDAVGTGERATAGRDSVEEAHDIGVDRIDDMNVETENTSENPDNAEELDLPPRGARELERRSEQR